MATRGAPWIDRFSRRPSPPASVLACWGELNNKRWWCVCLSAVPDQGAGPLRGWRGAGRGLCVGLGSGDPGVCGWCLRCLLDHLCAGHRIKQGPGPGLMRVWPGAADGWGVCGGTAICQTPHQPLPGLPRASLDSWHWYFTDPQASPRKAKPVICLLYPAAQLSVALSRGLL